MDKAKILRLIDEADSVVSALYRQCANKDYKCKSLREKLEAIAAEISAKPVTNGDKIRQMEDEELAEWFAPCMMCKICPKIKISHGCDLNDCKDNAIIYMKTEVREDA